jgi:hypothetical protein
MNLLKKKVGNQHQTKIQKRVSKISTPDLIAWSENALFVIGKELTAYQRSFNKDLLEEADMGAEALYAITQELKKRSKND